MVKKRHYFILEMVHLKKSNRKHFFIVQAIVGWGEMIWALGIKGLILIALGVFLEKIN
jgi:hypothetical protein